MPYIDLIHSDDCASIWFETSSNLGNVNSFDTRKPTVAMLHPMFLSSEWFRNQMDDFRLKSAFNMVAFDTRTSGKSVSKPSGLYDASVQAADLAYCLQYLHLPAVHILASETISVNCALRFAAIFPEMVLSLTLVNVPPPTELKHSMYMMDELLQLYCFAEDLDTLEHAAKEVADFLAGPSCDIDLLDDIITFLEQTCPPSRRTRLIQNLNVTMNRTPVPPRMLEAIVCPVLVIQSERSNVYPLDYAQQLVDHLPKTHARLYVVKDTAGYLTVRNPSIVNQTLYKFLSQLPRSETPLEPPQSSVSERMKHALAVLSELTGDNSFMTKEQVSSLSFSCVTPEVRRSQVETRERYALGARDAFSPLSGNGRPIRKYSQAKKDHWFHSESNGLSYADPSSVGYGSHRSSPSTDTFHPDVQMRIPLEPISLDVAKDARVRRTNVNSNSTVDKTVIRGTMAKVATSNGGLHLPVLSRIINPG